MKKSTRTLDAVCVIASHKLQEKNALELEFLTQLVQPMVISRAKFLSCFLTYNEFLSTFEFVFVLFAHLHSIIFIYTCK